MNKKLRKSSPYLIITVSIAAIVWIVVFFMQGSPQKHVYTSPFLNTNATWADSLIESMPLEEKVGQLIYYQVNHKSYQDQLNVFKRDNKVKPGGVFLEADSIERFNQIVKQIQSHANIPYLIGSLSASGLPQFDDLPDFPSTNTLHWINNDSLVNIYIDYITKLNEQLKIDLNILLNDDFLRNEIVLEDSMCTESVLSLAKLVTLKLQAKHILCGLYGYHYYPDIDTNEVFARRSYPYKELGNLGISAFLLDSVVTDHNTKTFFSSKYKFNGLILNYLDSARYSKEALEQHFINGGDAVITNYDFFKVHTDVAALVANGSLSEKVLNEKLRKVLLAKSYRGYADYDALNNDSLDFETDYARAKLLEREIKEKSIVLVKNENDVLPIKNIHKKKIHILTLGASELEYFVSSIGIYKKVSSNHFEKFSEEFVEKYKKVCNANNTIILAIKSTELDSSAIGEMKWLVEKYSKENNLVFANFGSGQMLEDLSFFPVLLHSTDDTDYSQETAAQIIFGGIPAKGKLAYQLHDSLPFNSGVETTVSRFKYTIPEEVGIASEDLKEIDEIANEAVRRGATPGCQVFVAKDGKVILNKAYGYHTYGKGRKVRTGDLYDIASITKVVGTTLQAMKMYDNKSINLNTKLSRFFRDKKIDYSNIKPDTVFSIDTLFFDEVSANGLKKIAKDRDTIHLNDSMFVAFDTLIITATPKNNIFKIRVRELLEHRSGLQPSMPILRFMLFKNDSVNYFDDYYAHSYDKDSSSIKIASGIYLRNNYFDTLWRDTKRMKVYSRKHYKYSDANMVLLQMALDSLNRRSIRSYMQSNFYSPLGLKTTCFKPLYRFNSSRIAPTERDKWWRRQVLRGYVHDPTAALIGGTAGNAGVFSNAHDIGVIFQMLLNRGTYGDRRFLNSSTVKLFTSKQKDHHRGLGFDMKTRKAIIAKSASSRTFGHTGFTGTCVWADPDENLIFVFLSNRVHPSAKNWRLNSYKIRQRIHEVIYQAIKKNRKTEKEKENKLVA